ncbi:hypothetical protein KAR91_78150 [Candidatus Pacearchaeota archaeon]|nr:hypothetical protein [Candidatus Pacearchaeota archaeon]
MKNENPTPDIRIGMVKSSRLSDLALEKNITKVVLTPEIFKLTGYILNETDAIERKEQGGFLGGVLKNETFYIFDNHLMGFGRSKRVDFKRRTTVSDDELDRRISEALPNYRTVIYHNHPPITREQLIQEFGSDAETYISQIKQSLEMGIYEGLGITTLDEAINEEASRILSQEDIENTPGRYNMLISPTKRESNPTAHLNFYDLKKKSLVPISVNGEDDIREELKTQGRIQRQWRKDTFGASNFSKLTLEQYIRAELIHEGAINPYA